VQANIREEFAMTAETKSPLEQVNDTLAQLKEMRHYSKNYVEQLTAQWLLFDGQLKKLKQAGKFEELMTRLSEFHDALDGEIEELVEVAASLQPPPGEPTAA
jgi:dynactin complex subunit